MYHYENTSCEGGIGMAITAQTTMMQMTLELPRQLEAQYLKDALAAVLYYNGTLTEKEARQMVGRTRREFEDEIMPRFGLSMIGGTPEDAAIEGDACLRA